MNIAIIPARTGSKRLPGKNIKPLAGKPMIAWTIKAALESNQFDHVFVSTDGEDIAQVAKSYGAEVPFLRPAELASDEATTNDVITHLVEWFEKEYSKAVTSVTILQPTSPLRSARHIKEAMELMANKSAKAVISVCEVEYPIQLCNKLAKDGSMDGFIKPKYNKRAQELEPYYRLNGAIYILLREHIGFLSEIYNKEAYSYVMEKDCSLDVDDEFDFKLTEFFMTL